MKMITLFLLISLHTFASDLTIRHVEWIREDHSNKIFVRLNLSWKNAWHRVKNHDAAWLFFKYHPFPYGENDQYMHAKLAPEGHKLLLNHLPHSADPAFEVPSDRIGLFISPDRTYRGDVDWSILVQLENSAENLVHHSIGVYGIEMVLAPEGSFTLGDPDTAMLNKQYSLYKSDQQGGFGGLYTIDSEQRPIRISPTAGDLYYHSETRLYQGDQSGVIPSEFPKGFHSLYMMKYELTQGQYADFLNSISTFATHLRANFAGRDYSLHRGGIFIENGKYKTLAYNRPANFISWDDAMAYADWAGLRPYTELEYEKACRGSSIPLPGEYAWNTNSKEKLIRYVNADDDLVFLNGYSESELTETNRALFGASYYWIMDLSGSVWERVITIGDSTGRAFKGTHGDGIIRQGYASNADWPKGHTETAGFGFRGGGYYRHDQLYGALNPNATIANRIFSAWSGGMRSKAYGSRFVRTKS